MPARDAMEYINEQDEATLGRFVERLEFRGRDPTFVGYAPLVTGSQLVPAAGVDAWLDELRRASEAGVFCAACNYYAYIAVR